ncbi:MAG: GNAT family N-acetyltransferase, partial [Pseudomonadota bacterium]|nr:GNAT family N-acetyltransferase [Pseudomonadota bacterium]
MKILGTTRLTLREFSEDDAAFYLRLVNEPSWLRYIGDKGVRTLDDARAAIRNGPIAMRARYGFGLYLCALSGSGVPIGMCGLIKRDTLPETDLGFAFLPEYWGQG